MKTTRQPAAQAQAGRSPAAQCSGYAGPLAARTWLGLSPRLVAQRQVLAAAFGPAALRRGTGLHLPGSAGLQAAQRVVQRHPTIVGFKDSDHGTAIEQLLTKHGLHYYHSYELASQSVAGTFADSKEDALKLARLLGGQMALLDQGGHAQDSVQRKLMEICELVRSLMAQTQAPESVEQRQAREKWYGDFLLNGLCLGFVRVFEQHPEWLLGMWRALNTWQPQHGDSVEGILGDLNDHIEGVMNFDDGLKGFNMLEAVLLAQEAWNNMNTKDEVYAPSPVGVVGAAQGSESDYTTQSIQADTTWDPSSHDKKDRWALVQAEILNVIGQETGRFHIIVYHEGHEMAVLYTRGKPESWIVVETNGAGIVPCSSWSAVGALIGVQLANAQDEFGVEVKRQVPRD
jgi:hypothetical protein